MGDEVGGDASTSTVYCSGVTATCDAASPIWTSRAARSGSMQSHLQAISGVGQVKVSRSNGASGSFTWTVTFQSDGDDFIIADNVNAAPDYRLLEADGLTAATGKISAVKKIPGQVWPECKGTRNAPTDALLTQGQLYYARVFAYNRLGYSEPQMAASPQKPMVVPGPPTGATLEVVSSYQLKVIFSPPDDDGGDAVTKYTVEWDTDSSFASANKRSAVVTQLQGGAPFVHTIGSLQSKLTKGTFYFVRVTASNSQGMGTSVRTSPASLNPSEPPTAPTGVELGSTSPSMLTVTFGPPVSDGGDTITKYQVEWDKDPTFNSLELAPHKGVVQVASTERSYTISLLTVNTQYYVRVSAVNGQGVGTPQKATPLYEKPQLQVPGKPVDVTAIGTPGKISVAWKRPVVPHHGLPCFGTASNPGGCPAYPGSTTSMSDGGAVVSKYRCSIHKTRHLQPARCAK